MSLAMDAGAQPNAQRRLVAFDAIRAVAAMAVCAGHLRNAVLVDYSQLTAPGALKAVFYFATGLGHEAVMVFFVLSGYFVGGAVMRAGPRFRLPDYAASRLTRLWVVLLPALLLTYALDEVCRWLAPEVLQGANLAAWHSGPGGDTPYSASLSTLLGNVFFLQTIATPVFGSNGPLWSLAYEFWYYALFPALAFALGLVGPKRPWHWRSAAAAGVAGVIALMPQAVSFGFLVWLLGVGVFVLAARTVPRRRPLLLALAVALFASALVLSKVPRLSGMLPIPSDALVGAGFALLAYVLAAWPRSGMQGCAARSATRAAVFLSDASYSLYAYHFPLVILLASLLARAQKHDAAPAGLLLYAALFAVVLVGGLLFWLAFERQTPTLRRWILSRKA